MEDSVNVVLVAPVMLLNVLPPSVLTCHCTVGVGVPPAAAVKVAVWPAVTVVFAGCVVTAGAELTAVSCSQLKLARSSPVLLVVSIDRRITCVPAGRLKEVLLSVVKLLQPPVLTMDMEPVALVPLNS